MNITVVHLNIMLLVKIDDDGYARSKSGKPILESLSRFNTLKGALADCDIAIAASGIKPEGDKRWFRAPKSVKELPSLIKEREKPALIFGRENYGLYREELALCEVTITIPTNPKFPILNLSHAVGIVLYEIYRDGITRFRKREKPFPTKNLKDWLIEL